MSGLQDDTGVELAAEILDGTAQRLDRTRRMRAEGLARAEVANQLQQCLDITRLTFATQQPSGQSARE